VSDGRRLAAVLYADLVGFTLLQAVDATAAEQRAAALREILAAEIPAGGGRLAERTEGGFVAEFASAGAAFGCAERLLARVAARNEGLPPSDRFEVMIGIAVGEVVEEGGQLLGLPVREAVAAHTLADPGGVAMTEAAHAQVRARTSVPGVRLGPRRFPNLSNPLHVFVVPPARKAGWVWALRKRRRIVPAAAAGVLLCAAAAGGGWLLFSRRTPAPPPAPPAPPRARTVLEGYEQTDYLSRYDGGGTTMAFFVEAGAAGPPALRIVIGGTGGWWGVVISKSYNLTGFDALVVPARSEAGSGFRILLKDGDEAYAAAVPSTRPAGEFAVPLASFKLTSEAKDGRLDLANIREIQLMHLDPASSDTLWIGPLAAEGPAAP
jgi:class 3 adenylate cyclase